MSQIVEPAAAPAVAPPSKPAAPPDWHARLAEQRAAIEAVRTELARQSRANWPLVFTAGSLGVSVLTVLGFLALEPLKQSAAEQRAALLGLREDLREHVTAAVPHPSAAVRVGAVEADVASLRDEVRASADRTGAALRTERELSEALLVRRLDSLERRLPADGS